MAVIASLNVLLKASADQFTATMRNAQGTLARFSQSVKGISAPINLLRGTIIGTGIAAFGAYIKYGIEATDQTISLAASLGLLSGKLQGLRFAAVSSGASVASMDSALQSASETIGAAYNGSEKAQKSLALLGLTAEDLINLPTDQAFAMIADRLARFENPAQRAAIAMKVLGSSARDLDGLLKGGGDAIRKAAEEAERLGYTLSKVDAGNITAAQSAIARLGMAIKALSQQFLYGISVSLRYMIEQVTRLVDVALKFRIFEYMGKGIGLVFLAVGKTIEVVYAATESLVVLAASGLAVLAEGLTAIAQGMAYISGGAVHVRQEWMDTLDAFEARVAEMASTNATNWGNVFTLPDMAAAEEQFAGAADHIGESADKAKEKVKSLIGAPQAIGLGTQADALFNFNRDIQNDVRIRAQSGGTNQQDADRKQLGYLSQINRGIQTLVAAQRGTVEFSV